MTDVDVVFELKARGECRHYLTDLWFPDVSWYHSGGGQTRKRLQHARDVSPEACAICDRCPVRVDCLSYAIEHSVDGIWAATGPAERMNLRRQAGIVAIPLTPSSIDLGAQEPTPGDEAA